MGPVPKGGEPPSPLAGLAKEPACSRGWGGSQGPSDAPPGTGHCDHSLPRASEQGWLWRGALAS